MNQHLSTRPPTGKQLILPLLQSPTVAAAVILLLGAVLRFMQMGGIRYGYDHSYPAYQALQLLDGRQFPLIGQPSSVFLDNPVLMVYLQAIPLLFDRSPWAIYLFIIALNTLAIGFVYGLGRELLGVRVGLIAAFLFAINPWVIFFSRSSWVQALFPLFMAVIAWGMWPALVGSDRSPRRFFAGGAAVTLLAQTYVQAWGILPQLTWLLLLFRRQIPRRAFWAAAVLFLLAALFYAGGLATRWMANSGKLGNLVAGEALAFTTIGGRHALRLVSGVDFEPAYAAADQAGPVRAALSWAAVLLLTAAVLSGAGRAIIALRRGGTERRLATILLIWFLLPVAMTAAAGSLQVHPHYLLLTIPAGHILAAWGVDAVTGASMTRRRPLLQVAVLLLLLYCGGVFAHDLYRANANVARQPVGPEFDGWSLAAGTEVGRTIRQLLDPQTGYPKRLVADGHSALLSGMSGSYVDTIGGVDYPDFVLLPAEAQLLYVLEAEAAVPEWMRPLVVARPEQTLSFANGAPVSFVQTAAGAGASLSRYPQELVEWPSEAGMTLVGYTLRGVPQAGRSFDLIAYWRVDDLHPDRAEWYVSPTYHLVSEQGQIVANVSEHGQYAHRWQIGDSYVERVTIPVAAAAPPGSYRLDIGLFDVLRTKTYTFFANDGTEERFSITVEIQSDS